MLHGAAINFRVIKLNILEDMALLKDPLPDAGQKCLVLDIALATLQSCCELRGRTRVCPRRLNAIEAGVYCVVRTCIRESTVRVEFGGALEVPLVEANGVVPPSG